MERAAVGVGFPGFTLPATQLWPRASSKDTCKGRKLSLPGLFLCSGSETGQNRLTPLQPKTPFTPAHTPTYVGTGVHGHIREIPHANTPHPHHYALPPGPAPDLESRKQEDSESRPLPLGRAGSPLFPPNTSPSGCLELHTRQELLSGLGSKLAASEYL